MRWFLRIVVSVMAAVATAVLAFDSSNVIKDSDVWRPPLPLAVAAICTLAASGVYGVVDALVERARARRHNDISVVVSELLFPLWHTIYRQLGKQADKDGFGVHAWLVPTWYARVSKPLVRDLIPKRFRRRLWTPCLWRAGQYRLKHSDVPTGIGWKRGKGAIGFCWKQTKPFYFNVATDWGPAELTSVQWHALDATKRLGLNYHEYLRVRGKYSTVLAVPVFRPRGRSDPQFLGCVTVDTPPGSVATNLGSPELKGLLVAAARNIERSIDSIL